MAAPQLATSALASRSSLLGLLPAVRRTRDTRDTPRRCGPVEVSDPAAHFHAQVRGRQKGLELHGPFHFSSDDAAERQRAVSLTRDTGPREPPGYVPVPRLMPRMRVERPVQLLRL